MADEWTPAFPGQRPPFRAGNEHRAGEGNTLSTRHGAYSSRTVAPLAAEIEAAARADESWPPYLTDPSYAPAVAAWATAEAVCVLLRRHVAGLDLADAIAETADEESTTERGEGGSTRTTRTRRTRSALDLLHRSESSAATHRARLGLDPASRARLGRDVTAAQTDLVQMLTAARERAERDDQAPDDGPEGSPE